MRLANNPELLRAAADHLNADLAAGILTPA
jgi:hypothetical protein